MLALLLLACGPGASKGDDSGPSSVRFSEIEATLSDAIPAVVVVTFRTDSEEPGFIRFGPEGEEGWTASATAQEDGSWRAVLVGLPAASDGWFQVGAGDAVSDEQAVTTGPAPAWADLLTEQEGDPTPGFLVTGLMGSQHGAAILDTRGRPVWWWEAPDELSGHLHTAAHLSADLQTLWFDAFGLMAAGTPGDGESALVGVAIDGSEEIVLDIPYNHHDFAVLEDGTLAWLEADARDVDGVEVRGDRVVERAPDESERVVWSTWDTFTYGPDSTLEPDPWWTLCNHLELDAAGDRYVVGSRNLSTLVAVDRATGETLWTLGEGGTLVPDEPFQGQHGLQLLEDGVLVFDNGDGTRQASYLRRYTLDEAAGTATQTWIYAPDPAIYSYVMGDVVQLENGHVLADFSTAGTVHELDEDGALVASFTLEASNFIGFLEWRSSLVE